MRRMNLIRQNSVEAAARAVSGWLCPKTELGRQTASNVGQSDTPALAGGRI